LPDYVTIFSRQTGRRVAAEIIHNLDLNSLDSIAQSYRRFRDSTVIPTGSDLPENSSWDWSGKGRSADSATCKFLGLRAAGEVQGLLMLNMEPWDSRISAKQNCLYVEYIETAPWNQPAYNRNQSGFAAVGIQLLRIAVSESIRTGYEGRLALHSLPQSVGFYREYFIDLDMDASENLRYFELTREGANQLLTGRGQ
jgi:hypothetical protein